MPPERMSAALILAHLSDHTPTFVVQLREKKDEAATRDRFWDITQSKIGQLTGTTAGEESAAAEHADEASKMAAKFAGTGVQDEGVLACSFHVHLQAIITGVTVLQTGKRNGHKNDSQTAWYS